MAIKLMDTIETAGDFPVINAPSVGLPNGARLNSIFDESGKIKSDSLPEDKTNDPRLTQMLDADGKIKEAYLPEMEDDTSDPRLTQMLGTDGKIKESYLPEMEDDTNDPRVDELLENVNAMFSDDGRLKEEYLPEIEAADPRVDDLLKNPVILPEQNLSFAPSPDFVGVYLAEYTPQALGLKPVTAGTKYLVQWGDAEFEETAFSGELPGFGSFVAIGNGEPYKLPESDAPFLIAINEFGVAFFAGADSTPSRQVGIKEAEVKIKESYLPEDWVKGYVEEYINEALGGEY